MKSISDELLKKTETYVYDLIEKDLPEGMCYHTADHARHVVNAIKLIGKNTDLSNEELNTAIFCGWMHDVGYTKSIGDHETESAKIATAFLKANDIDQTIIDQVHNSIMATKIPQSPTDLVSQVMCDADMLHLASPDYYTFVDKMREEQKYIHGMDLSRAEFDHISVVFFDKHEYHTEYGKTVLQAGKEKNYQMIKETIEKSEKKGKKEIKKLNKEITKLQGKLEKSKGYSRGVESMLRVTARNQINLSSIADNKSNILISVNTIIISIVLTVLVSRFSEYPSMIFPSLVFLTVSLVTIIFAILSTRPNISSGKFTKDDIKQRKVNLLFFGNFYNMGVDDYEWAIDELMKNEDDLYTTMVKDQYYLGKVLAKKYKLLRKAYNFFMYGLVISVIAFVLSFINF